MTPDAKKRSLAAVTMFVFLAVTPSTLNGQSQTGQISGTVVDPTGAIVAGATVRLVHDLTRNTREFTTESTGVFIFPNLLAGNYSLTVEQPGFMAYTQRGVNVSPSERVDLHQIRLSVGQVSSSIEVSAGAARVQTSSSERAGLINPNQVQTMPNRGRDYLGLLKMLPGVLDTSAREAPGDSGNPQVNGGQAGSFLVSLDGIPNQDVGCAGCAGFLTPSVDAIAEVKVMLSGTQAEFGARSGGQMSVAIKNGTSEFHGAGYYYWRHEMFNANTFSNNKLGVVEPKYRYKEPGYTIGGPVLIPGTDFNRNRDKLFFFWSHDMLLRKSTVVNNVNLPSELERSGNFSQSYDGVTNQVIVLKDPTTGLPLPNNQLPASLQNTAGRAILNLFPKPMDGITDPTGRHGYNARYILPRDFPNNNEILRVDWNIGKKTMAYARYIHDYKGQKGPCAMYLICSALWPQLDGSYDVRANGIVGTVVHTFSPTLVNAATYGVNFNRQQVNVSEAQLANINRGRNELAQSLPAMFYPDNNTFNLLPVVRFTTANGGGTIPNPATLTIEGRFPYVGTTAVHTITDDLSWIKGAHNVKAGFYMERTLRYSKGGANTAGPSGIYDFGSDAFNGSDTGWGYANALAGVVKEYRESNRQGAGDAAYSRIEWFAQDTWKASRRLTLDYGLRFTFAQAINSRNQPLSVFEIGSYQAGANPPLIKPACRTGTNCPSGANRVAIDPVTGNLLPQVLIGALSNSRGAPYQAAKVYQETYHLSPPVSLSPRFGFAWDIFGNGKMALRGAFGVLYDTSTAGVGDVHDLTERPPATLTQILNYTMIANMRNAPNYFRLSTMGAGQRDPKLPATLNWHLGLQRDVGAGLVLDVAYVANSARHMPTTIDINAVAPGTAWSGSTFTGFTPWVVDSTNNQPLPTDFLRPYQGYAGITYRMWSRSSNYNSLQVMLNRRFGQRLTFGGNYTFSRTLTYTPTPYYDTKLTYTPGNTRKHNFNMNWTYAIPDGSRFWKNTVTRFALDGWRYSGYLTMLSGSSAGISYTLTGVPSGFTISGSPTTSLARIQVVDPSTIWTTPKNSMDSGLNPAAFAIPPVSTRGLGNGPPVQFWGPGQWNADMSLFKSFKLSKEKDRAIEFRVETYNTFNHPNYGNPNTAFQSAWNGGNFGPNTNIYFGRFDASNGTVAITGQPRIVVLAGRIRF